MREPGSTRDKQRRRNVHRGYVDWAGSWVPGGGVYVCGAAGCSDSRADRCTQFLSPQRVIPPQLVTMWDRACPSVPDDQVAVAQ